MSMSSRTRTSAAAFLGMAWLLPFHGARPAVAAPEDTPVRCIAEEHDFTLRDLRGRYVVVHFLASGDAAGQQAHVRSYLEGSRSLAGVHNVFIRSDEESAVRTLAAAFPRNAAEFALDAGGKLAREFRIDSATGHALVVLDESGREILRLEGSPSFEVFAPRFRAAWVAEARGEYNLPKDSTLAVQGYDVVSYVRDNAAARGDERFSAEYRGVTYRFTAEEHRGAFVKAPRKYLPAYGGWCASAIGAKGEKVGIDPTNFKVKDGRLFLFYRSLFADALKDWNRHEKEWEPAADANWRRIAGE